MFVHGHEMLFDLDVQLFRDRIELLAERFEMPLD
jgi:hypothetical protein